MNPNKPSRSYISSTVQCRCPRCREGKLFKNPFRFRFKGNLEMNKICPICGQPSEIEVGFYYGTGYVSYALTIALTITTLVAWWVLVGFSTEDNRFFWWMGLNATFLVIIQPWIMRLSRSIWISWFVSYDPEWKRNPLDSDAFERINTDQSNNW